MLAPDHAVTFVTGHLRTMLATGTYSRGFLNELALCFEHDSYNVFSILNEVAILEGVRPGPSWTKDAAPFRGRHLRGLWHKHHSQARFIVRNVHMEMHRDGTVERVLRRHMGEEVTPEIIRELTHALVVENYTARGAQGRLTGEWIVFAKTQAGHRYLTLASHEEGDKQVLDRLTTYLALDALPEATPHAPTVRARKAMSNLT